MYHRLCSPQWTIDIAASLVDELEDYLRQPVENIKVPLQWWVHNQKMYPNLHWMALVFLLPQLQSNVYFHEAGTFYALLETACPHHQPVHSSVLAHGSAVVW